MPRRSLTTAALIALGIAMAVAAPTARADTIGPLCWRFGGEEVYRLYFAVDPANPVAAPVAGEAVAPGVSLPVSGAAIASGETGIVRLALTVARGFSGSTTFFVRADFSLDGLAGQAVCQLANGEVGGCAMARSWSPVACP